jgi:small subunit ribosomal protein S3
MGQKVNPVGFRVGVNKGWLSVWFSKKDYASRLHEDLKIRDYLKKKLYQAGVSKIIIERPSDKININVHAARPGVIIGKKGAGIDTLKSEVQKISKTDVSLNIFEVRKAEIDAQLAAESVALQLERRVAYRRAMKRAMSQALKFGAKGIKVMLSGRLAGSEMARCEWYAQGSVPLHTLKADIDYGLAVANTTYGTIGVKVWIYKGNIGTSIVQ